MKTLNKENITGVAALLVHAAKIDEHYTDNEKKIIKSFINSYVHDGDLNLILSNAEKIEKNSNQLLNFTSIIKKESDEIKSDIIRHLWKIIISDKSIDQYESNLVRRICGLIYFSDKLSAEIKLQVLNKE
jgi:uncharacterized tellurite resistance protein B-like protein